jgi:hypothetical protein
LPHVGGGRRTPIAPAPDHGTQDRSGRSASMTLVSCAGAAATTRLAKARLDCRVNAELLARRGVVVGRGRLSLTRMPLGARQQRRFVAPLQGAGRSGHRPWGVAPGYVVGHLRRPRQRASLPFGSGERCLQHSILAAANGRSGGHGLERGLVRSGARLRLGSIIPSFHYSAILWDGRGKTPEHRPRTA